MKKLNKLLSLLLLLAVCVLPAGAENTAQAQTAYIDVTSSFLPTLNEWLPLLQLDGVEDYTARGQTTAMYGEDTELNIYYSSSFSQGIDEVGCTLTDGRLPGTGECLISTYFSSETGLLPGDELPLSGYLEETVYTPISGIYQPDEEEYGEPEVLMYFVFAAEETLLSVLNPDVQDCFIVDSILVKDDMPLEDFMAAGNELMADCGVRLINQEEKIRMAASGEPVAGETMVSAISGMELFGGELPEEILVPGGVTMVNIWATYCNPCISEMPDLGALNQEYADAGRPFRIVGVCLDATDYTGQVYSDLVETGRLIVEKTGASYLHIIPDAQMFGELAPQVTGVPTTFFLNDAGEVLGTFVGSRGKDEWREIIEYYLAQ